MFRFRFILIIFSNLSLFAVEFLDKGNIAMDNKCNNCRAFEKDSGDNKSAVYVFISFSVPETTWLELDKSYANVNKIFVIRGIPNNSFEAFRKKISTLKEKGVHSSVEINPELFTKYEIKNVPSFVVMDGENFNKVSGNISLKKALEIIEKISS